MLYRRLLKTKPKDVDEQSGLNFTWSETPKSGLTEPHLYNRIRKPYAQTEYSDQHDLGIYCVRWVFAVCPMLREMLKHKVSSYKKEKTLIRMGVCQLMANECCF